MASAAAISMLMSPPRVLHPRCVTSASSLPMHALPFLRHRPRSLTTACAAVQTQGTVQRSATQQWTRVPVSAITPATEDETIYLITLDLTGAPDLVAAYTTPGQYLLTRVVPSSIEKLKLRPAYTCISSAPLSGLKFDLLVRCVPGTTSEQLCKLRVGDVVELGPVTGKGFAIQHINPPQAAESMFVFAVAEGISPIRALIEFGFDADKRNDVTLYYAAKDRQSMPYQERFKDWEKTGVKVVPITKQIQECFSEQTLNEIKANPLSTRAVIVAPFSWKEEISEVLFDFGVPHDKALTIEWCPHDPFCPDV